MTDLDEVRAALEYERVDLYGLSYGTRAALTYLRMFPERVRAVILDGVVPPTEVLGLDVAADAQRAIDLVMPAALPTSAVRPSPICRRTSTPSWSA
jgi:pimeloyl-ACP methyl ester carboxylesterase